jgi:plastocyanin
VSTHLSPLRTVAALGATIALTLAACGGDDDDASATTNDSTPPPVTQPSGDDTGAAGPAMEPATITAEAQQSDGTTVTVASIELPSPGFVAVHADGGGSPGPVIGHSALLPAGTSTDVVITLDEPLTADATVYPMAHIDVDGNGQYDFAPPDVTTDGPALIADGDVAVVPAAVTVTGGSGATSDATSGSADDSADGTAITIEGFAFTGATEVAVGTTVTVTNNDSASHTWTADDGTFDSGGLGQGDSFEFTFTEPGTYTYHCNIHPAMTGTIVVTG